MIVCFECTIKIEKPGLPGKKVAKVIEVHHIYIRSTVTWLKSLSSMPSSLITLASNREHTHTHTSHGFQVCSVPYGLKQHVDGAPYAMERVDLVKPTQHDV